MPLVRAGEMTGKMERFCEELLVDFNYTAAAIRAGYSAKIAAQTGSRLMAKPAIIERLRKLRDEQQHRTQITADRVLLEKAYLAFSDPADAVDEDGGILPLRVPGKDQSAAMPEHARRAIASIEVEEIFEGRGDDRVHVGRLRKVKFWDKNGAGSDLMKHLGLFEKDNQQKGQEALNSLAAIISGAIKGEK